MMKPNSILGSYLIKQTILNFLFVLAVICAIIMMFDMIEILRKTSGRHDVSVGFLLQYVVAKLPETVDKVVPFVIMVSTMIAFWRLSKTNEFVIIRASGVSIWGVLTPVLLAVFGIGLFWVAVFNPISAKLYELKETLSYRLSTDNPNAFLFSNKGLWIREGKGNDTIAIINAGSLNLQDDVLWLRDVSIIEVDERTQVKRRIEAFVATLEDGKLNLRDVRIYRAGEQAEILNNLKYPTEMNLQRIKDNFVDPEAISFWNLPDTIKFYETSGFSEIQNAIFKSDCTAFLFDGNGFGGRYFFAQGQPAAGRRFADDCIGYCNGVYSLFYFTSSVGFWYKFLYSGLVCSVGTGNYCGFNQHIGLSA